MSCTCGCCTGVRVATPAAEENRPGLRAIRHRPGGYASFLGAMHARLASTDFPQLAALRTRDAADPSIALCDGWAIAAEVLSFYQDRIANEGYLRTATERNSILQLGRLTGYEMRPGVSASAYLAYTVDANASPITIAVGTRVQSVPAAGEKMQTFETAEALDARPEWSQIKVRMAQPQWRAPAPVAGTPAPNYGDDYNVLNKGLYFDGTSTQLKPNDALLIDYGGTQTPYRVDSVAEDAANKRTWVRVRAWNAQAGAAARSGAEAALATGLGATPALAQERLPGAMQALVGGLTKPLTVQPRNASFAPRALATTLAPGSEPYSKMLLGHLPALKDALIPSLRTVDVVAPATPQAIKVYALRGKAGLFASNAPDQYVTVLSSGSPPGVTYGLLADYAQQVLAGPPVIGLRRANASFNSKMSIALDAKYEAIKARGDAKAGGDTSAKSYLVVDYGMQPNGGVFAAKVLEVVDNRTLAMSLGAVIAAQVSLLTVDQSWLPDTSTQPGDPDWLAAFRGTRVCAQSEPLALAADPLTAEVAAASADTNEIELDRYYDGITPGMWVIVGGQRADLLLPDGQPDTSTRVDVAERAMIAAVRHALTALTPLDASGNPLPGAAANLPGDTLHTFITFANALAYRYRRDTFTIYGNVVRATHGQTTKETLGSGDATQIFQQFALKAPPLTRVSAPTPDGVASTLQVRVNQLLWHETDDLAGEDASARAYRTRRDDSEATSIMFGDGNHGARLPTGQDNVAAVYRSGIGAGGNVRAGQLTVLADKPLGASAVTNPIRASGGADADTLAQARVNAPLSVTALDRLVSVRDYADFASTFAGIGKATAIKLPGPGGDFVEVTVAGIDDAPIDASSDLYRNLVEALHAFGDPHLPIRVDIRDALALVIEARVALRPDYDWNDVQPRIVAALNGAFGFQARGLGQPVFASEVIAAIQSVRGVAHVAGGSVHLLDDGDLIAGLAPASPTSTPAADSSVPPSSAAAGATEKSPPWFALVPEPGAGDEGDGANGWLAVPAATAQTAADGTLKVSPAQIAYLPANVLEALILELAS
ncbi:putative baseplate assembly protein [Rudaea sp.]|uniref:putative baseplate assembly protein n=1 Tax=Rudaea sp. TaxID=2136325 RepID=UPI00321FB770